MRIKMLILFLLSLNVAFSQNAVQLTRFSLTVKGTSNLHDWESEAKELRATGSLTITEDALSTINSLTVEVPVKSIKSSKGSIMDGKTHKALEANKHPNISFKLSKATVNQNGGRYDINATRALTIAGTANTVKLYVQGKKGSDGSYTFSGSKKLKMTDYKVDPPTALLGTLTTGDEVEIVFSVTLKPL